MEVVAIIYPRLVGSRSPRSLRSGLCSTEPLAFQAQASQLQDFEKRTKDLYIITCRYFDCLACGCSFGIAVIPAALVLMPAWRRLVSPDIPTNIVEPHIAKIRQAWNVNSVLTGIRRLLLSDGEQLAGPLGRHAVISLSWVEAVRGLT